MEMRRKRNQTRDIQSTNTRLNQTYITGVWVGGFFGLYTEYIHIYIKAVLVIGNISKMYMLNIIHE